MTIEFIFAIVTAVVTAIVGTLTKDNVVPSRFIPLQNLVIGIVASVVSISMGLFNDVPTAVLVSLGMAFGVGGAYDLKHTTKE